MSTLAPEEAKSHRIEINGYAIVSDDHRIAGHDGLIPASLRNGKDRECFQRALAGSDLRARPSQPRPRAQRQERPTTRDFARRSRARATLKRLVVEPGAHELGGGRKTAVAAWRRRGGAGRPGRVRSILEDRLSFDARAWRKAPGGRALFSGCDASLSAEAVLARAKLPLKSTLSGHSRSRRRPSQPGKRPFVETVQAERPSVHDYLYSHSAPTPALDPPLASTPACRRMWRVTSRSTETPLSLGLAPVVTPTLIRSLIARPRPSTGLPFPLALELMLRLLTPSDRRSRSKASPRPERVATELASSSAWKGDRLPDDC